jgi:hypothetical protein
MLAGDSNTHVQGVGECDVYPLQVGYHLGWVEEEGRYLCRSFIMSTTSCLSFGANSVSAVFSDIPFLTRCPLKIWLVTDSPSMVNPLGRIVVFHRRLKTCFQSKSEVRSSSPHFKLNNANWDRVSWRHQQNRKVSTLKGRPYKVTPHLLICGN